jgi:hypothetical protein
MALKLLPDAFKRHFGEGIGARLAAYEFAENNDCIVVADHEATLQCAEFSRKQRPRDTNQLAKRIVDIASGDEPERDPDEGKDPAAVSLGRRSGLNCVPPSEIGA